MLTAILLNSFLYSEEIIEFYGTKSSSADVEMIGMTTDLYFNQLQNTRGYSIIDKRDTNYDNIIKTKKGISFYAQIEQDEEDSGLWTCTLHAVNGQNNKESSIEKCYESYYKILLDAKSSINSLLTQLSGSPSDIDKNTNEPLNIQDLYGTWDAENSVNKIVIMQNSKGFVIYDNGSSMNVSVTIDGSNVTVRQVNSDANQNQQTTWNLVKTNNGILKGKKTYGNSTTDVEWTKR